MKYIYIKLYDLGNKIYVNLCLFRLKDKRKLIEKEMFRSFESIDDVKAFIDSFDFSGSYIKSKILFNYITNLTFVETIQFEKEKKLSFNDSVNKRIQEYYPNYQLTHDLMIEEYQLKNRTKYISSIFIPKKVYNILDNFNYINHKKISCEIDCPSFQKYLNKNNGYFKNLFILLIINEGPLWRYYEILCGKLTNFIMYSLENESANFVVDELNKTVDRRYDHIVIDCEYKQYLEMQEKWKVFNVTFIDYFERLKYVDEKKIICK